MTKSYLSIYAALLVLLGATYWLAQTDLGRLNTPVALGIAAVKAGLVALVFMELRASDGVTRLAAFVGPLWFAVLLTLALSDFASRGWLLLPGPGP